MKNSGGISQVNHDKNSEFFLERRPTFELGSIWLLDIRSCIFYSLTQKKKS